REAVETVRVLLDLRPARHGGALLAPERGGGEEPAEIPVSLAMLHEEPEEPRPDHRDLGADERPDARPARGLEEARRAVHAVPIGERERVVARRPGAGDRV